MGSGLANLIRKSPRKRKKDEKTGAAELDYHAAGKTGPGLLVRKNDCISNFHALGREVAGKRGPCKKNGGPRGKRARRRPGFSIELPEE